MVGIFQKEQINIWQIKKNKPVVIQALDWASIIKPFMETDERGYFQV